MNTDNYRTKVYKWNSKRVYNIRYLEGVEELYNLQKNKK